MEGSEEGGVGGWVRGMDVAAQGASGGTQDPFISVTIFTLSFNCLSPDWGQASTSTHTEPPACTPRSISLFSRESAVSEATLLRLLSVHDNPTLKSGPNIPENILPGVPSLIVIIHFGI